MQKKVLGSAVPVFLLLCSNTTLELMYRFETFIPFFTLKHSYNFFWSDTVSNCTTVRDY